LITPGGSGTWVTDELIKNNFTSSTTIPRNLKAGNYVIRHEIIALHSAGNDNGAQFYPQVNEIIPTTYMYILTSAVLELESDR
jgi:cellulase